MLDYTVYKVDDAGEVDECCDKDEITAVISTKETASLTVKQVMERTAEMKMNYSCMLTFKNRLVNQFMHYIIIKNDVDPELREFVFQHELGHIEYFKLHGNGGSAAEKEIYADSYAVQHGSSAAVGIRLLIDCIKQISHESGWRLGKEVPDRLVNLRALVRAGK